MDGDHTEAQKENHLEKAEITYGNQTMRLVFRLLKTDEGEALQILEQEEAKSAICRVSSGERSVAVLVKTVAVPQISGRTIYLRGVNPSRDFKVCLLKGNGYPLNCREGIISVFKAYAKELDHQFKSCSADIYLIEP